MKSIISEKIVAERRSAQDQHGHGKTPGLEDCLKLVMATSPRPK